MQRTLEDVIASENLQNLTHIGVTGHQKLSEAAIDYVSAAIRQLLADYCDITGYSSLAAGADQLFAKEILAVGGRLHAVIPAAGYASTLKSEARRCYERLLSATSHVTRLPFEKPGEMAYDAAGRWITGHCEVMIAVWDGEPVQGLGGTADAVAHARALGKDVRIIWPQGMTRD